jgi:hypothetical protein
VFCPSKLAYDAYNNFNLEPRQPPLPTDLSSWIYTNKQKQTPGPSVGKRTIPTERPPLVGEILVPTFADRGVSRGQRGGSPTVVNLKFLDRSRYFSFK